MDGVEDVQCWGYFYGYVTLEQTQRVENGEIILGGICRHYDRNGKLISESQTDTVRLYLN